MDIKLKNNNKIIKLINKIFNKISCLRLDKRIWIISLCISIIPILLGIIVGHPYINRFAIINCTEIQEEIRDVANCLNRLNYLMMSSHEQLRNEAVKEKINELKDEKKKKIEEAKSELKDYVRNNNIDEAEISSDDKYYEIFKNKVADAEKEYNKGDSIYKEEAVIKIKNEIEELNSRLDTKQVNVEYYIKSSEGNIITNIHGQSLDEIIKETLNGDYKDYIILSDIKDDAAEKKYISKSMEYIKNTIEIDNTYTKIIRISKDLKQGDVIYNALKGVDRNNIIFFMISICLLLDLIVLFALIFSTTKNLLYEENIISKLYSKLYVEIRIIIPILICILLFFCYESSYRKVDLTMWLTVGIVTIFLYAIISDLYKKIKLCDNKGVKFICADESIIMKIYKAKYLNSKNNNLNINKPYRVLKLVLYFVVYFIIVSYTLVNVGYSGVPWLENMNGTTTSFLVISIIITVAVLIYMIIKCINLCNIKNGLEKIIQGNYIDNMEIYGFGIEKNIADNIANIREGFSRAIDDAVKSERMKSELITNVSHDLKTPLTSIINYVDLLSKEGVTEEDKEKYLSILNERSQRLKVLIEDLFEASKAASGALVLNYETLDPVALIRQVLGELNDRIMSSGLEFIKNVPEEKVYIVADGRKTFRIIQNLISNILKYSSDKSRVYIDVIEEEDNILMVFKNISRYRLNCGEEELMERFKRGDSSRTTQGNGLGLSIAKSLTEAQGGKFNINIDGDLFKAEVSLKKRK